MNNSTLPAVIAAAFSQAAASVINAVSATSGFSQHPTTCQTLTSLVHQPTVSNVKLFNSSATVGTFILLRKE